MGIRLLGTLEVIDAAGESIDIGGAPPRVILALLVAAEGRVVPVDGLIDAVWDDSPPPSASGTLQTYVSRLRRALDEVGGAIVRAPAGYRLEIDHTAVDVHRFESLADEGRGLLEAGDAAGARAVLVEAEQLWRGPALIEVRDRTRVAGFARRLDDRRLAAVEHRVEAELALGRHTTVVAELAQLVGEHPLREGLWELLAIARYRSGMQAEALRAINHARDTLVESLGVEPGARLRNLEQAILCHDPTLDLSAPIEPRGAVAPARLAAGLAPPPVPTRSSMFGRDHELGALTHELDEAAAGHPRIAVLQGEAGVGKTRLVEELAALAGERGSHVVWGRALEGGAAPAYWPWLAILREMRTAHAPRSSDALDQLLDAAGGHAAWAAIADRSQLLDGVLGLLTPSATGCPLVVVVEDVQWADVESLELATHVASGLTSGAVLIVFTLREGDDARRDGVIALLAAVARRGSALRLRVRGLEPDATAALLAEVSGRPIDRSLAEAMHERVDGNPFYAIELQRLLDAEGVTDAAAVTTVAVPVGVRDVVRQRLTRLPAPTLDLLRLAAVAGRDIDVEILSAASGRPIDASLDDLEVALDHGVLADAGPRAGLRFAHAIVREVLVDDLSSLRRARLHLSIADAIVACVEGDEEVELVAEHLWAAVPLGVGRRAADALDRAAEIAIVRFAVGTACDLLGRSLELRRAAGSQPDDEAAELDTLLKLVWALRARGGYQGGLGHYARGAELASRLGRHEDELEMQWAEWAGHSTGCDFERALPLAIGFRDRAESSDDQLVSFAGLTAWAIHCWHGGDLHAADRTFARVAQLRPAVAAIARELSLAAEIVVLANAFALYLDEQVGRLEDPDGAFAVAAAAVEGNFPKAIIWTFACTSAASVGDIDRVERSSRHVLDAEAGETLGFWGSQARMHQGAALIALGQVDEGRQLFDVGRKAYDAAGMRTGLVLMHAAAASAEITAGDLVRAARHVAMAQDELLGGEGWPAPFVLLVSAALAEARGESDDEVADLRQQAEEVALAQGAVAVAAAGVGAALLGSTTAPSRQHAR